jgi:hypothetical protein
MSSVSTGLDQEVCVLYLKVAYSCAYISWTRALQHTVQEAPAEDLAAASRKAEAEWEAIQAGAWPFQSLCNTLCADLVSPRWESRHGCAMALREVLRSHACAASVRAPLSAEPSGEALEAASIHQNTLCQACAANLEGKR